VGGVRLTLPVVREWSDAYVYMYECGGLHLADLLDRGWPC
jgi:hypothetical protein